MLPDCHSAVKGACSPWATATPPALSTPPHVTTTTQKTTDKILLVQHIRKDTSSYCLKSSILNSSAPRNNQLPCHLHYSAHHHHNYFDVHYLQWTPSRGWGWEPLSISPTNSPILLAFHPHSLWSAWIFSADHSFHASLLTLHKHSFVPYFTSAGSNTILKWVKWVLPSGWKHGHEITNIYKFNTTTSSGIHFIYLTHLYNQTL